MTKWLFLVLGLYVFYMTNGFACTADGFEGFVPENKLYISTTDKGISSITKKQFNAVINKVVRIYEPIITARGGKLNVIRDWKNGTVNAYASRFQDVWTIRMFGGLARHNTITADGFALVVCHELGHHIGGLPKKTGRWATNEGQADYFATMKCMRKAFRGDDNIAIASKLTVPQFLKDKCSKTYPTNRDDQAICQRVSMGGMSTAKLFQLLRRETVVPQFDTPSSAVVSTTSHSHPATQCRLDTYFSGAICDKSENDDVADDDEAKGVCYRDNGYTSGVRPLCWFKPTL